MLVLSRRTNDKIVFPSINATIQIVAVKAGTVRLGIDAPHNIPVFREEILGRDPAATVAPRDAVTPVLRELAHQVNNRLNSCTIGVALLRRQLDLGMVRDMGTTLGRVERELAALKEQMDKVSEPPACEPVSTPVRKRALLVEDDLNECELLAGFLRLAGLEVETAGDGSAALDLLKDHAPPDVVVLDMFLPRCDGPTTVKAIRENPAHAGLKIFGVTGADHTRFDLPEGPRGINRWFRKPLNPEMLLRDLQQELRGGN